jgi:hypothetical protein
MWSLLVGIFKFISALMDYYRDERLVRTGRILERQDVDKANTEARELADEQTREADAIRNDSNVDDSFLLPPEERNNR